MRNLEDYLLDTFTFNNYINNQPMIIEGLDIDIYNRTVSLTNKHSKGINFEIDKPIYRKINGMNVYSIFKRTKLRDEKNINRDGNPFIYALKGINKWKFDISDNEIREYCRKFINQCDKLDKIYDTIIIVPSGSDLNKRFMKTLSNIIGTKYNLEDFFHKVEKEYADDSINITQIKKDFGDNYKKVMHDIYDGFMKMKGKYFEAKYIDKKYLKYIDCIISSSNEYELFDCLEYITNKNVLVLDDTISSGETVSRCVKAIQTYAPKKIDVITLLSKL